MTDAFHDRGFDAQGPSSHASNSAGAPTVASLGVQVRLIPIDRDRERDFAQLIVSCERLRNESERLFHRILEVVNEGRCSVKDSPSSSYGR